MSEFIDGLKPNSGLKVYLSKGTINSPFTISTSTLLSGFCTSIRLISLKLSTKNPDLNLSPTSSIICNDFVSSSSIVKLVTISKLVILLSSLPISLIVYLLLSTKVILALLGL